ncbi:hypothetical protein PoB_000125800 [Plakobranchus ocellatus]|uniref:Uncharacterized protein n=1 Tax=Plakobranchus ocellatus TaxID=259542 RepID=A0AAV3XXM6_9GAST|nr:hypothetical protein PoB_000125800 [Plakobranchus ocellatus]
MISGVEASFRLECRWLAPTQIGSSKSQGKFARRSANKGLSIEKKIRCFFSPIKAKDRNDPDRVTPEPPLQYLVAENFRFQKSLKISQADGRQNPDVTTFLKVTFHVTS